jgi:signal transduction histidine kinase
MEKMKKIPLYRRFALKVFMFNFILLFATIIPVIILQRMDYKYLMDRSRFHISFFQYCADRVSAERKSDWPAVIESFPRIFYQQRACVFTPDKELVFDSGVMKEFDGDYRFGFLFPDPYIDWRKQNGHFDPGVYVSYLRSISLDGYDDSHTYNLTRTVRYDEGDDRIILSGRLVRSADGEALIFTMSHSLVDILIHARAVKERFLFVFMAAFMLGLLLTVVLGWSVTSPLKRLYAYSREILASGWKGVDSTRLPERGEIGAICLALQSLIKDQKGQSENFRRLSSDIVHELKTPLAAIRSGLEVYSESSVEAERADIYNRMNRVIQQMESLMNEIQFLGSIESSTAEECCTDVPAVVEEVLYELKDSGIALDLDRRVAGCRVPVSDEKVYQILVNLLKNAVSFSPEKGSVSASLRLEEGRLSIMVRDRGPGIPEEIFPRITDRFFTYRPSGAGRHSGLGLSIVDAVLRGCGGSLEYRNVPEGGAEFACSMPSSPPEGIGA